MGGIYDAALGYEIAFSYRDIADEVDAILRLSGVATPTSVLELAAGPAEHAIECAKREMRSTALDMSPAMCAQAAANATAAGVVLDVIEGDMRDFSVPQPVDLAFCMISSISHITSLDDMVAHLGSVRDALAPGGVYLIEGSHPADYLGPKPTVSSEWDSERDGIKVHLRWGDNDVTDPVTQLTAVRVLMTITDPDGGIETYETVEPDRFWTATEMQAAARLAGMTVLGQYGDFDGRSLSADGAWRMITVLQAIWGQTGWRVRTPSASSAVRRDSAI